MGMVFQFSQFSVNSSKALGNQRFTTYAKVEIFLSVLESK